LYQFYEEISYLNNIKLYICNSVVHAEEDKKARAPMQLLLLKKKLLKAGTDDKHD